MKIAAAPSRRHRRRGARSSAWRRQRAGNKRRLQPPFAANRFEEGFAEGYREGVQAGMQSFAIGFEGTSIVIPTYNQADLLKQCIDSIVVNTDLPYEVIVVDNASTDGTAAYLAKLGGQVRYRVLEENKGFAGAINVGLMMAKGSTVVLLNNDTLVTERWLDNMLACLNSDERIGMVGPVTNYISGEQQIKVGYADVRHMPSFAREYNRPDPSRWRRTDRLVGFCLLFRRELFRQIGYFDEGFELGNFEDDDFNIRVRMLEKTLVIAEDTFIHHYGSVSMKALGDRFTLVNDRNHRYFLDKWQNPYEWIHRVLQLAHEKKQPVPDMTALYPSRVAVRAIGAAIYWIENGVRHPVEGILSIPVTRLSQVDIQRWPLSDPIGAPEAEARWLETEGAKGEPRGAVRLPDGTLYMIEGRQARRVISPAAIQAWNLDVKPFLAMEPEQLAQWDEGLPIIAPPQLRQVL
jgi:GT2 family glycosyltransferase